MTGAKALFGAIAALCALWPLQGFAAEAPASAPADNGASSNDKDKYKKTDCNVYGPKFFRLGQSVFCGKFGYDLMGFAAKDFASYDIG